MKTPKDFIQQKIEKEGVGLTVEIIEKMAGLVTAALGLILAFAWNAAIQSLFALFFPKPAATLIAQLIYAVFVTVVIVFITIQLGRMVDFVKHLKKEMQDDEIEKK